MNQQQKPFAHLRQNFTSGGKTISYYSLPALSEEMGRPIRRLPVSIRVMLESLLRNCDGRRVTEKDVHALARWEFQKPAEEEIPFIVARILLQDFTGVPLLVDLAAMRAAAAKLNVDPRIVEPLVPVELVIDHSVQVDYSGGPIAFEKNLEVEFRRNRERYEFLKWGQQAFESFKVIPPAVGIVHQVNLEYLARAVITQEQPDGSILAYPDTLVGTDSHTTMINGLGILGWGVGGIEAEAGMLGQPIYLLTPEVVGVHLRGHLHEGVTATDLVLRITELLRKTKVVGKFVEFFGEGTHSLTVPDRATIGNMAPEYGATIGYFPCDEKTLDYLRLTGRAEERIALVRDYLLAQRMFGIPSSGEVDYTTVVELDLSTVEASVAGPKRPQDRIALGGVKSKFKELLVTPVHQGGFGKSEPELGARVLLDLTRVREHPRFSLVGGGSQEPLDPKKAEVQDTSELTEREMANNRPTPDVVECQDDPALLNGIGELRDGSVVIAAITSCTNTSNPAVMIGAGLLAKKAVERGLMVPAFIKTSLAPGSRVVSAYLEATGLQKFLDQLRFNLVGYGCTTCIGNSGPLPEPVEKALLESGIIGASVLSGNRNFEARIHSLVKANFLMSPPLVVAFALAGRIDIDFSQEPLAQDPQGQPVYLRDIWPSDQEIADTMRKALQPETFRVLYRDFATKVPAWNEIPSATGVLYQWDPDSTYIQEPPFFHNFSLTPEPISEIQNARALGIFGDSVTTDHISPAGSIRKDSPAGIHLLEHGVPVEEFNSYGARRGNDRVMTRGTFANLRIRNLMVPGLEGGWTRVATSEVPEPLPIYFAAQIYARKRIPLIVFGGKEYGTGSSRDWAAKGSRLLGVRAVITESFERIHRSNLVGMGILPCNFEEGTDAASLNLDGSETFSILGLADGIQPKQKMTLEIVRRNGFRENVPLILRIDTPIEVDYYRHGGILPYMLRQLIQKTDSQ
jgi:aconitate hydratase